MSKWFRKKERPVEIDNSLEVAMTQGRVSYITSIKYDLVNKGLKYCLDTIPETT